MAVIKHLVDLDLTKQQLLNAAVQNLAVPAGLIILQNMIDSNTKSPL